MKTIFTILFYLFVALSCKGADYPYPIPIDQVVLPNTKDLELHSILHNLNTIYYKLPKTYQKYDKHLDKYDLYSIDVLSEFNANKDFPWVGTFGISPNELSDIYTTINFLLLPKNKPIVLVKGHVYTWIFPNGTYVGEILYTHHQGKTYCFEIRLRQKENYNWQPYIYRPLADKNELEEILGHKYEDHYKWLSFRNPEETEVIYLRGLVERIPDLTEKQTKYILSLPFKEVTYEDFGQNTPMSDQDFSIFPKDYALSLLGGADDLNCSQCHKQTGIRVSNLIPKEPFIKKNIRNEGSIRGSDGIFTWHPWHFKSIRYHENDPRQPIAVRKYDKDHKIIVPYDPTQHKDYKLTKYVQKALGKFELPFDKGVLHDDIIRK